MNEQGAVAGHAFISYVREDSREADKLQRTLEAAGIPVWRDTVGLWPGEDWGTKIRRAITNNARVFIACFSRQSLARIKSYQYEELVLAIEQVRQRRPDESWLIPVRFDDCNIPDIDIGGGRTLASIQKVDLFGDGCSEAAARLVAALLRILGRHFDATATIGTELIPDRIKDLLPYPEGDIQLDDLVTKLAGTCVSTLTDSALFPVAGDQAATDTIRYVVVRADSYFDAVQPLARALAIGCAWGGDRHNLLWRRVIEAVARTAAGMPIGQQVLLDLRAYPVLLLVYSAGLAAVHRENWTVLRAVTSEAQIRDETDRKIPVIGTPYMWMPFRSVELAAQILAFETDGAPLSEAEIEALRTGGKGRYHTPVSDHLHGRLRPVLSSVIHDDADYDEAFDELEVLLAVVAADAAVQAARRGKYLRGSWIGAFTWRRRFERPPFEQQVWARHREALLRAGFFGGDFTRADGAFKKFAAEAQPARTAIDKDWRPARLPRDLGLTPTPRIPSNRKSHPERVKAIEQAWESVQSTLQAAGGCFGAPCLNRKNGRREEYDLPHEILKITSDRRWKVIISNIDELSHVRDQYERQLTAGVPSHPNQMHWRPPSELTEYHLSAYCDAARQVCREIKILSSKQPIGQPPDNVPL